MIRTTLGRLGSPTGARNAVRGFAGHEGGFVLVFVALALPVLIGLVGLVIDGGRLLTLDTQLAAYADAAALAGASQLDRSEQAIVNARRAAAAMRPPAGIGGRDGVPLTFRFAARLDALRTNREDTLADSAGASARFVEVTTAARSLTASFLQVIGISVPSLRRAAIAEASYQACDVTPVLMCHRDPQAFFRQAFRGRQYLLRYGSGGRADGTLGLIDQTDDAGGRKSLIGLASDAPSLCYTDRLLPRLNVAAIQIEDALNVRFDRYVDLNGPIAPELAVFPPAPNVIQGKRLQACASDPHGGEIDPPYHLPRDAAFRTLRGNQPYDLGRGDWRVSAPYGGSGLPMSRTALEEYVGWNHSEKSPIFQGALISSASRYDLYLRELGLSEATQSVPILTRNSVAAAAAMPSGGPRAFPYSLRSESAVPRCYAGPRPPTDPRRRVLYVAIADCGAPLEGSTLSLAVAKLFLTEPAESGQILAEFVSRVGPRDDEGKLRQIVRLVDGE